MTQLPDRSALMGLRPLMFLLRQRLVLVPSVIATLAVAIYLFVIAVKNGKLSAEGLAIVFGLAPVVGLGVVTIVVGPIFMLVRACRPVIAAPLQPGESVLHTVLANHLLHDESRGGRLLTTEHRVLFVPHRFNIQLATIEHRVNEVQELRWGHFVGGLVPTQSGFLELVEAGRVETYIVRNPLEIGTAIERQRS